MLNHLDQLILNETPDAIVLTSPAGKVVYWSKGAESIFGYSSEEAVNRSLNELIVPQDRVEEEYKLRQETLEYGVANCESLCHKKDRSLVFVHVSSKTICDSEGEVQYIISSKKDVTHLKALRDGKLVEAKFRDLLESMPDGIVILNLTGRIIHASSQAERCSDMNRVNCVEIWLKFCCRSDFVQDMLPIDLTTSPNLVPEPWELVWSSMVSERMALNFP